MMPAVIDRLCVRRSLRGNDARVGRTGPILWTPLIWFVPHKALSYSGFGAPGRHALPDGLMVGLVVPDQPLPVGSNRS